MGAYYGGTAFLQGSAKAKANAIINQGQQIAAAWITYTVNNGGNRVLISDGNSSLLAIATLIPTYLQNEPSNPAQPAAPTLTGWNFINSDDDTDGGDNYYATANSVIAEIDSREICLAVRQMSAGSAATLTDHGGGDPFGSGYAIEPANGKFDCFCFSGCTTYFFVYKVF